MTVKRSVAYEAALGGFFLALFFLASNVIPPLYLVPGVPVTLQILVVALMGGFLGLRGGLVALLALFAATLAGLPFMSSFHAGPAAFATPTGGFILGFVFVAALTGLCRDLFAGRKMRAGRFARLLYPAVFFLFAAAGVLLDYACGTLFLLAYNHLAVSAFGSVFAGMLVFLPFDGIKCAAAAGLCSAFLFVPGLRRYLAPELR